MSSALYTIGHSTRSAAEFVALLSEHGITLVADVRSVPHSAHNPQFDMLALQRSLPDSNIRYLHLNGLGGFRHSSPDSPNSGWRNQSFRAYADYMQTDEFAEALDAPIVEARAARHGDHVCRGRPLALPSLADRRRTARSRDRRRRHHRALLCQAAYAHAVRQGRGGCDHVPRAGRLAW